MVFSSFLFLCLFLPGFLFCYFIAPRRFKNAVALVGSYAFYAWGAPKLLLLFFSSCLIDYVLGRAISAARTQGQRKLYLGFSIAFNVGALLYYKYANFFVHEFNRLLLSFGCESVSWTAIALPIGISFFTFHKISYIVDVYRNVVTACRSFVDYALYIALFPQLIAGPIIRYHDISDQLVNRTHSLDDIFQGAYRFCLGLGKKVLIADAMGNVADNVFHLGSDELSTPYAWLGIICYAYQIYFDFSGYSDMAIGLGRMMGFHFLENFNRPYIARNFTDFWHRWHISLSRWMKDYLYIPLGGNRGSKLRTYFNLWTVFFISGLWHGANWTFLVWGLYHGFFLVIDKLFWINFSKRLSPVTNTTLTFILVLFGWVLFRSDTFSGALQYLLSMLNFVDYTVMPKYVLRGSIIHNQGVFVFCVATLICFLPALPSVPRIFRSWRASLTPVQTTCLQFGAALVCLVLSICTLSATDYTPFIYFRF